MQTKKNKILKTVEISGSILPLRTRDAPNPNGIERACGSMEPEISTDDLVFVKRADELHVGDVVLYNTGGSNVLHRITKIDGDIITTQGDANNTEDKPFSKSAVLGVYIGKIPSGGKIIRFVTNPPFVMAVVFLLMAAAVIWMFVEDHRERKKLDSIKAEIESIKAENEELRKKL